MPLFSFEGKSPRVHPTAFIAPTACLIGDVTVEENASVWYNAVVRADFSPIIIRRGANVQDCSVIHVTPVGGSDIGRLTLHPGWRWSEHVRPIAGTDLCEAPHFQYHVAGTLHVVMADGTGDLVASSTDIPVISSSWSCSCQGGPDVLSPRRCLASPVLDERPGQGPVRPSGGQRATGLRD